uniref:SAC domain-containing protein n=1 Tax=Oryza meridionalis TaxID=40149 RepID=A0A0E0CLW1_9ORYZ
MGGANDSSPSSKLHTRLRLWEFPDRYVFEPIDGLADLYLSANRSDGSMNLVEELPPRDSSTNPKCQTVYGVIGVLKLSVGSYFLVITGRDCVGSYLGHAIFKVTGLKVLPCSNSRSTSGNQSKMETEFSELLHAAEKTIGLYFSYDINLTLTLQRLHNLGDEFKSLPLWRQAEPRFLWNSYLLEPLIENKNIHAEVGSEKVNVTLIARRCTRRIGTRMWRRGADPEGYAANFVESEQIMESKGFTASYVQVRGSIPFLWEQIVDLTYKPSFDIVRQEEAPHILERHFHDLQKKYGAVLAVDLVNTHGGEGRLHDRYAKSIEPILSEDIRYVHFDFHRICGHIHFERLSQLYDQIEDYLKKHRYFLLNGKGEKLEEQTGTIRTNCVDCLDRTNVTQSMIGRKIQENQLQRIGVLGVNDTISNHPAFDAKCKVLWANHGDSISTQYSGTPALKGDFVRYGKRSTQGILNDLWNSLARYYLNNFADGTKQDAMDLLQGHYITSVSRDMAGPSKAGLLENYASFRLAFALVMGALMFMMMSLRQARNDVRHLVLSLLWAGLCIGITHFVRANGRFLITLNSEVEAKTDRTRTRYVYFTIAVLSHRRIPSDHLSLLLAGIAIVDRSMEIAAAASRAVVDTSRPFQSVREAVEVFGERCLSSTSRASSESGGGGRPSPPAVLGCLRKLEAELAEVRGELERLRQRQSHMEMAVSSVAAQLSTGLAILSAGAARDKGKELAVVDIDVDLVGGGRVRSDRWDESRAEEWMAASLEYLPSLSEALAIKMVDDDRHLGERRQGNAKKKKKNTKNAMNSKKKQQQQQKKKNGVSFVGRIFSSRKDKSSPLVWRGSHEVYDSIQQGSNPGVKKYGCVHGAEAGSYTSFIQQECSAQCESVFFLIFFFFKAKHELTFSSGTMAYRSDGETQTLAEKQDYMM